MLGMGLGRTESNKINFWTYPSTLKWGERGRREFNFYCVWFFNKQDHKSTTERNPAYYSLPWTPFFGRVSFSKQCVTTDTPPWLTRTHTDIWPTVEVSSRHGQGSHSDATWIFEWYLAHDFRLCVSFATASRITCIGMAQCYTQRPPEARQARTITRKTNSGVAKVLRKPTGGAAVV